MSGHSTRYKITTIGGGGGGGTAVVRWGPNFGTPGGDSLPQKATLNMPQVQATVPIGQVHTLGGALGLGPFAGPNQVQALAGTIGPTYSGPNQVQAIRHTALALSGALGQVESIRHTQLALAGGVAQIQAARHTALALVGNVAQVQALAGTIGPSYSGPNQIQSVRHSVLALSGGVAHRHALAGSALGAPFWQSVFTDADSGAGTGGTILAVPATAVVGDLLLVFCSSTAAIGSPAWNTPSGWTDVGVKGTNVLLRTAVFYRIVNGTEPSTYEFTTVASADRRMGELHHIKGVDTANPINVSAIASLLASALDPDPDSPSVTTTVANCLVFAFLCHDHAAIGQTHTVSAGQAERTDFQSGGATQIGHNSCTRVYAATGATLGVVHNCTESVATDAIMHRVAIAPGSQTL